MCSDRTCPVDAGAAFSTAHSMHNAAPAQTPRKSPASMREYHGSKRILITGGAGFLGSHLCDRLLEQGHEVLCADNLFTGGKRNIAHLHDHPRFEFIRHDVTFPLYVEVDEIYNLAC